MNSAHGGVSQNNYFVINLVVSCEIERRGVNKSVNYLVS